MMVFLLLSFFINFLCASAGQSEALSDTAFGKLPADPERLDARLRSMADRPGRSDGAPVMVAVAERPEVSVSLAIPPATTSSQDREPAPLPKGDAVLLSDPRGTDYEMKNPATDILKPLGSLPTHKKESASSVRRSACTSCKCCVQ